VSSLEFMVERPANGSSLDAITTTSTVVFGFLATLSVFERRIEGLRYCIFHLLVPITSLSAMVILLIREYMTGGLKINGEY